MTNYPYQNKQQQVLHTFVLFELTRLENLARSTKTLDVPAERMMDVESAIHVLAVDVFHNESTEIERWCAIADFWEHKNNQKIPQRPIRGDDMYKLLVTLRAIELLNNL